jgi:hypothetical protein
MDFVFESLGDEKFQKFCQALLIDLFPNLQCLPVGQPDGGRDAINPHHAGAIVFQVKFTRNPSLKEERDHISEVISSEKKKVHALIKKGVTGYYLLTNVSGTAHPEVGSIDKVNAELTKEFGVPCYVWWRDDLERRLESSKQLLWRYPELARGSDFLEFLATERQNEVATRNARVFSSYMSAQHLKEADVKFQEVQIQSNLLDLFTDTPIGLAREKMPSKQSLNISESDHRALEMALISQRHSRYGVPEQELMAAQWLLKSGPQLGAQRIVLERAPGQGKSTVTQYLCQVHRAIALKKSAEQARIPNAHLNHLLRLPMRVDLRDYALWLTGKDPMAGGEDTVRPVNADESLESFISYQVHKLSGGKNFDVDALSSVLAGSHCILVLDGFDEVADTASRSALIDHIRFGTERLSNECQSIQVIVTSRPAAFILSPGFPEREWAHVALLPLSTPHITEYTDKWIRARGVEEREGRGFKELLLDRINRPHIKSLAQNPMQLAILLNLISTKGMSLPDKRTALYDSYIDLFFGREAEKSPTVRENRDILIQIHQYVAWKLQLDAEIPGGRGSISQKELEKLVRDFLIEKEHKGDVLPLFTGAVERVGALVSRVQGTLEFEVQPLREYFAGRFLYETAPYSPAGAERHGTKPERFAALARRPYWSNVLRFYSGCYSSGELLSLISGLEELNESAEYSVKMHALQLSVLLLGDYVFAQEPKTVQKVIEFLTMGSNLRYLLAHRASWEAGRLTFPDKCGKTEIAEKSAEVIAGSYDFDYIPRLGALYCLNSSFEERWNFWQKMDRPEPQKLSLGSALGIFREVDPKRAHQIIQEFDQSGTIYLVSSGRWDDLNLDQRVDALNYLVLKCPTRNSWINSFGKSLDRDVSLLRVYYMMEPNLYRFLRFPEDKDASFSHLLASFAVRSLEPEDDDTARFDERGLSDIVRSCERSIQCPIEQWRTDLAPWNDVIESARRTWGECARIKILAALAAGIRSKSHKSSGFFNLLDTHLPLAERSRYARLQGIPKWWRAQLQSVRDDEEAFGVLLLLFAWAPGAVIAELTVLIEERVDSMLEDSWRSLFGALSTVISVTGDNRRPLSKFTEGDLLRIKSERLRLALMLRAPKTLRKTIFTRFLKPGGMTDATVVHFVARNAWLEAARDQRMWPLVIEFYLSQSSGFFKCFEMNHDEGLSFSASRMDWQHKEAMISSCAKSVMSDPSRVPIQVLEFAEMSCLNSTEQIFTSLGEVAVGDRWFEAEV